MSDVKWIKIVTDIFDDEKILLIEELPEADSIIVIWFKLLCLAGKQNNSGVFMINDSIPYTDKMLATIFRRKESTVKLALDTFKRFRMIEIIDGVITIPNWGKHQNFDKIEAKNEYMRNYMRDYRQKQKLIATKADDVGSKDNSKSNSKVNVSEAEIDIEVEEDKEVEEEKRNKDLVFTDVNTRQTDGAVRQAIMEWNRLEEHGIKPVQRVRTESDRYRMMNQRIKEYGLDEVIKAIKSIPQSDFLLGRVSKFQITFDWFVRPNNFPKVHDGNYIGRRNGIEKTYSALEEWQRRNA